MAGACVSFGISHAQGFTVPDGPRHFIVLVDSSKSMTRTQQKRNALNQAERHLSNLLFKQGPAANRPWYRPSDKISILFYGIDTQAQSASAYKRLRFARLEDDYIRPVRRHPENARELQQLIRPAVRTNLNVLAWALPLGIYAAEPPPQVQETYVILLNDAQMNDGSMVLEKKTLEFYLPPTVRENLARKEEALRANVRLTDAQGQPGALFTESFGDRLNPVTLTAFRTLSQPALDAAAKMATSQPFRDFDLYWRGNRLQASISVANQFEGRGARLSVTSGNRTLSKSFTLGQGDVSLGPDLLSKAGEPARAVLYVESQAGNPLLGNQRFEYGYERQVQLPDSPNAAGAKRNRNVILFGLLAAGLGAGWWWYRHRTSVRHFQLWLPDYNDPFQLPPISAGTTSHHVCRMPLVNGDTAAHLELPSVLIRRIFYRDAVLVWDPRLSVEGFGPEANEASLADLPQFVALVWRARPPGSDSFDVTVRRGPVGQRNQRLTAVVKFLPVPRALTRHQAEYEHLSYN